jgi:xanthine dehydrogenase YagT iron-sulfur-binding subunit
MAEELRRGDPSHVTVNLAVGPEGPTRSEIAERMSGNLCRCGAHNGIVSAIEEMLVGGGA